MKDLTAGRDLNELVAENVMGWKKVVSANGIQWIPNDNRHPCSNIHGLNPPHYSTDIKDAWKVVEKFSSKGREVRITTRSDGTYWDCEIQDDKEYEKWVSSFPWNSIDAPEAICLAALKAVGK